MKPKYKIVEAYNFGKKEYYIYERFLWSWNVLHSGHFRLRNYKTFVFSSLEEAEAHIRHLSKNVNQKEERFYDKYGRWINIV
jgi:hypothetical protein